MAVVAVERIVGKLERAFDAAAPREILDLLRPDNVYMQVVSRDLETDSVTSFYDVAYAVSDIDPEWIERWKSLNGPGDLALPEPNQFVPERLDLLALDTSAETPALTEIPPGIELWYRADQDFGRPLRIAYIRGSCSGQHDQ